MLAPVTITSSSVAETQATGDSAGEGYVSREQLKNRPLLRPGELLETVPGLIVTQHSGDGKANQYFLRGFNLDHGTDLATTFNGMPANMPSNAHGQGYTDLNFVMPELVDNISYKKGPYFASEGDFATAGAVDIEYVDHLDQGIASLELGSHAYRRGVIANSNRLGPGTLLYGFEWEMENGPWDLPEGVHKLNGVMRYTVPLGGGEKIGVTAMAYRNAWNSTDQVPERAIAEGLIDRFGALDPTDGGATSRYSLSVDWSKPLDDGLIKANVYVIKSRLQLFSDFTFFLDNPVQGDQFEQYENRVTTGANIERTWFSTLFGHDSETSVGFQSRFDRLDPITLANTHARDVIQDVSIDTANEASAAVYAQNSTQWLPWFRTVAGLRVDQFWYDVSSELTPANSGSGSQHLVSPKFSMIFSPTAATDVFINYGRGYHSNDIRGATETVDPLTGEPIAKVKVLVPGTGYEVGFKTATLIPGLQFSASLWQLDLASELVYDGDTGTTEPSGPSRRRGVELATYYKPNAAITLDADGAWSHARFRDSSPDGDYIPEAIETTASAGLSIDHDRWSFGARLRYFGPRVLTQDGSVHSPSSFLVNMKVGYQITKKVHVFAEVLNVLNSQADDIDYYYATLLKGEVSPVDASGQPTGINDQAIHPAEPRELRVGMVVSF
ncbi:MAG: TonB-dependent receptor [Pararobbsia sp.]